MAKRDYPRKWYLHRRFFHFIVRTEDKLVDIKHPALTDERADKLLMVTEFVQKVGCFVLGHDVVPDQCNIPAHDFCAWCQKPMPNQAHRSSS